MSAAGPLPRSSGESRLFPVVTALAAVVVPCLVAGIALWRVNRRNFLVRHQLTEEEEWIVDTDQRMASNLREFRGGAQVA